MKENNVYCKQYTLYTQMGTGEFNSGGIPAMDCHPCPKEGWGGGRGLE